MFSPVNAVVTVLASTVVDWSALGKVVLYSLVIVIGVTTAFSLAILGVTRFADLRNDQRMLEAGAFAVLAALGAATCLAALVLGIFEMTSK
jgi:hypothetical protein